MHGHRERKGAGRDPEDGESSLRTPARAAAGGRRRAGGAPGTLLGALAVLVLPALPLGSSEAGTARAQSSDAVDARPDTAGKPSGLPASEDPAVLDTVVVLREDLFAPEDARGSFLLRFFNDLHATTRPGVIRRELLLRAGEPYDSARAAESERQLRSRQLFRKVEIDTGRVDGGRLAAIVRTKDAWSLEPRIDFGIASDGTVTGSLGATESNVAGTGNILRAWYLRDVDRDGLVLGGGIRRLAGSELSVGATYMDLSDRNSGSWGAGDPFRSLADRWSVFASGQVFDGRVLQFRSPLPTARDTVQWTRRALVNRLDLAFAPEADATGYVRVGLSAEVRREEYFPRALSGASVPDSVYGLLGAWIEVRDAEFYTVRHFNGFTEEDQDLSRVAFLEVKLAPDGWGYGSTGMGTRAMLAAGTQAGDLILKGRVGANALWNAAGLDSGRVSASWTAAVKPAPRHVTFLNVSGGVQENPPPGGEIDLGYRAPPRLWEPHAFTGTRSVSGTLEHRWYVAQEVGSVLGLGAGGFLDYGGAWYRDQDPRYGGNLGLSLFIGSALGSSPQLGQLSIGWRFGDDLARSDADRWVASLQSGLRF